jgi:DNA-binding NarL/FixJ family response regulator
MVTTPPGTPAPQDDFPFSRHDEEGAGGAQATRRRLAIVGPHSLVGEAVGAALAGYGFDGLMVRWADTDEPPTAALVSLQPDCALLMTGLEPWSRLRSAQALLNDVPMPWVLLTGTPIGPFWGAMLESGAAAVLSNSTPLEGVVHVLDEVTAGRAGMDEGVRQAVLDQWLPLREEQVLLAERMTSLTPREQTVLKLLYAGEGVRVIALTLGVSEATVRSQVKSVLRKLDVNSQLAAVAVARPPIPP